MNKKVRALVLFSGGLDSMLAVRVLQNQGIEVVGLCFESCFFDTVKARESAKHLGVELREENFSDEHLKMTKNPKHGYGKNLNPCIDCHGLMLRHAKKIMEDDGFDFVATGEVLGQRAMSQNRRSLKKVAEISELGDFLLRPLSAKLLDETDLEKTGIINREELLDIEGRRRDRQFSLAKKYDIQEYPSPGGGCSLTGIDFGKKLKALFLNWPSCDANDTSLLKMGRIYWFNNQKKYILVLIGRDMQDNENMLKLKKTDDYLIELIDEIGPRAIIRGLKRFDNSELILDIDVPSVLDFTKYQLLDEGEEAVIMQTAATLTAYYATKLRGKKIKVKIK